ncbi:MAG: acetyltransferase [Pseudomonadota bacterium]
MRIVLLGGGGHCSDVLGAIEAGRAEAGTATDIAGILDDEEVDPRRFAGRGVRQIGALNDLADVDASHYVISVGYPAPRKAFADLAAASGKSPMSITHPRAWLPEGTPLGDGSVVLAGACISPGAAIGAHVLIGAGAIIGHDCQIGDFVSVMPGATVSGDTRLGEGAMIGANATVLQGRTVGDWAQIGAGAVVTKDVPDGATATGIPARWN